MKKIMFFLLAIFIVINAQSIDSKIGAFKKSIAAEKLSNYNDALSYLSPLKDNFKSDYLFNLRMGWLNYLVENYDESVKYYQEAVRISQNGIEAMLGLTYPYSAQGKWSEISGIYKSILEKDALNYTANLRLGQIYLNGGDYKNAKIFLEKVYQNYQSDYEVNLSLGWAYYYLGNNKKARELFSNALIANSGDESAEKGLELTK